LGIRRIEREQQDRKSEDVLWHGVTFRVDAISGLIETDSFARQSGHIVVIRWLTEMSIVPMKTQASDINPIV